MSTIATDDVDALFARMAQMDVNAEIVDGEIVELEGAAPWPGMASGSIYIALANYVKQTRRGFACAGGRVFRVHLPRRESFSPSAAYYVGPIDRMRYYLGSPTLAVETRNAGDYGSQAERRIAAKRTDYFAAGTLVVWDVDLLSQDVVSVYRHDLPETPTIYRPGDIAEAEPAVPGWTMPVNDLLPDGWAYPYEGEL